jgi:hypothetical protein
MPKDVYSKKEADQRRDKALRNALSMAPISYNDSSKKKRKTKAKKAS